MTSLLSIVLIAIGLSMDSFAVSLSNGMSIKELSIQKMLLIAFSLAFFQAVMPLLGWLSGIGIEDYIKEIDHWIAFVLLSFIGGKMVYEGFFAKDQQSKKTTFKTKTLILQSIATSIDAFAVGISFAFLDVNIIKPVVIIGLVTFLFSITGLVLGKTIGKRLGHKAEIFGGLVLIGIGTKILIEHLFFA